MPVEIQVRGGQVVYVPVAPKVDETRADVREAAYRALLACVDDLGISPMPNISWLPPERRDVRGFVDPDDLMTILVKPQEPADVAETVAHELKHLQQLRQWGSFGQHDAGAIYSMESRETAARDYGLSIRAAFVAGGPLVEARSAPVHAQRSTTAHDVDCDLCDRPIPRMGAPHHCRPMYSTAAIDALMGRSAGDQPYGHHRHGLRRHGYR